MFFSLKQIKFLKKEKRKEKEAKDAHA